MYKVFFNDRAVYIGSSFKKSLTENGLVFFVSDADGVEKAWNNFKIDERSENLFLISDSSEEIKEFFFHLFKIVNEIGRAHV